ncbi:tRNA (adenine22-N1)-methyltransferase [Eubacterium ruminantium]|nr:tRNA (adenine22-N1)-methyltransferase [Eubacterium ruminantium]
MFKKIEGRLSDRMLAVAEMVNGCGFSVMEGKNNITVADIGCDHAFISIYLIESGIAGHVIAMDINEGPLKAAEENVKEYGLEDSIELRLSNGFEKLSADETDAAIIAGMGGYLVIDILKAAQFKKGYQLILSPQSDLYQVRSYLLSEGFDILDENMIKDAGKYYNIIRAVYTGVLTKDSTAETVDAHNSSATIEKENAYNSRSANENACTYSNSPDGEVDSVVIGLLFGRCLIEKKNPVLREYLLEKTSSYKKIISNMEQNSGNENSARRVEELKKEIKLMNMALESY